MKINWRITFLMQEARKEARNKVFMATISVKDPALKQKLMKIYRAM